jgi:hypothetical protein
MNNISNNHSDRKNRKRRFYKRKSKYISSKLFKEGGYDLSDVIYIQYNVNADNLTIYDLIGYRSKRAAFYRICKSFSKSKRPHKLAEIARNRMRELIAKEPNMSSHKIKQMTGYGWPIVTRYYMTLKTELHK